MVGSGNGKGEPDVARPCCPGGLCQWSMFTMMLMTNLDLGYSVYRLLGPPVSSSSSLFPFCPRLTSCHGVAGLPCRFTQRFAPQAQSSMSSRHGKVPGAGRFSETSRWWPLAPFVCVADSFPRAGGQERTGGSQDAGDGREMRGAGRLSGASGAAALLACRRKRRVSAVFMGHWSVLQPWHHSGRILLTHGESLPENSDAAIRTPPSAITITVAGINLPVAW